MARMHSHSCHGPEGDLLKGRTGARSVWRTSGGVAVSSSLQRVLCTFYYDLFFLREIAYLQAPPRRVASCHPVKNLNKISRFPEVPNTL